MLGNDKGVQPFIGIIFFLFILEAVAAFGRSTVAFIKAAI